MSLLSTAHDAFRSRLRQFVDTHLLPHADAWEHQAAFPRDLFLTLGREGFLGLTQTPALGGQGLDFGGGRPAALHRGGVRRLAP